MKLVQRHLLRESASSHLNCYWLWWEDQCPRAKIGSSPSDAGGAGTVCPMHQAQFFVSFQVFFRALVVSDLCGVKVASYLCLAPCPYLDLMEGERVERGVVDVHGLGVDKHRVLEDSLVVDVDSLGMQAVDSEHNVHKDLVVWKDHIQDSLDRLAVDML